MMDGTEEDYNKGWKFESLRVGEFERGAADSPILQLTNSLTFAL
jgi:hypothetical protein